MYVRRGVFGKCPGVKWSARRVPEAEAGPAWSHSHGAVIDQGCDDALKFLLQAQAVWNAAAVCP